MNNQTQPWRNNRAWPLIHLRSTRDPRMARCGRFPTPGTLTDEWNAYTCGACLIPYRPGPLDPR